MRRSRPRRLRQLLGRLVILSALVIAGTTTAGGLAYAHLLQERDNLLQRIDPADMLVAQMLSNFLDQETSVRGYALTGQSLFLQPYESGADGARTDGRQLAALLARGSASGRLLAQVNQRYHAWLEQFAQPSLVAIGADDRAFDTGAELTVGKDLFDSLRQAVGSLQSDLGAEKSSALSGLDTSSSRLLIVLAASVAVILLDGLLIWLSLRRLVLDPLAAVGADARQVAAGELQRPVAPTGPLEVSELATDIEAMRQRIFAEMATARDAEAQLAATNAELARSNEDLERFAYVASHDLQEPLRKVSSFCQLLEQRYGDQLDERGVQYIAFAVDGARRMQGLINDLLAFSRIGRTTEEFTLVELGACVDRAVQNLAGLIESEGAEVVRPGALPAVFGDPSLLTVLMQNLIGNAVKFHADSPPVVEVAAAKDDDEWLVSVTDNGIGIEPRFSERIFVIFQRLHGRDAYPGTGIGLAMARKIVEFHGGRIWLDTSHSPGTRFCLTLPATRSEEDIREPDAAAPVDRAS